MYIFALPIAVLAFAYGLKMVRLRVPPDYPMRTLHLGAPITDPVEKLATAHQIGWIAIMFAVVMLVGPALTMLKDR